MKSHSLAVLFLVDVQLGSPEATVRCECSIPLLALLQVKDRFNCCRLEGTGKGGVRERRVCFPSCSVEVGVERSDSKGGKEGRLIGSVAVVQKSLCRCLSGLGGKVKWRRGRGRRQQFSRPTARCRLKEASPKAAEPSASLPPVLSESVLLSPSARRPLEVEETSKCWPEVGERRKSVEQLCESSERRGGWGYGLQAALSRRSLAGELESVLSQAN